MPATQAGFETMGWAYQLLPFVEQDNLARIGQTSGPYNWDPSIGKAMVEVPVKIYNCPSRGGKRQSVPMPWGSVYAMGDYAGVMVEWGFQYQATQPPDPNEPNTFSGIIAKGGHYRTDNPSLTVKYGGVTPAGSPTGSATPSPSWRSRSTPSTPGRTTGTGGTCPAGPTTPTGRTCG